jgi:hypothetical protein
MEIANAAEAVENGRIFIELLSGLYEHRATPAEYGVGRTIAGARGARPLRGRADRASSVVLTGHRKGTRRQQDNPAPGRSCQCASR